MKVISNEEKSAHSHSVLVGGIKGLILGTAISVGIYAAAPSRFPRLLKMPWSVRTAVFVIPVAFTASVNAELCSSEFDYMMYSSEASQKRILNEHRRWTSLSTTEKIMESVNNNKYGIIVGLWGASMWGSWVYVNKDKLLTRTQKFVQARMYAQFLTVGLLLASMGLSMYEENIEKEHQKPVYNPNDDALNEVLNSKQ
ncbi:Rcf2 protein [Martiniozyma asiatica (nom. inval.)]|nr:Rcf2 protein [Martiniozyma asiatica]